MSEQEFVDDFREITGTASRLTAETVLADLPEWDSLTMMGTVTLFASKYSVMLTLEDVQAAKTLGDLIEKARNA